MIRKKKVTGTTIIDLDGPEGNAHNIIGTAVMLGRECGYDDKRLKLMVDAMKMDDYIHLLKTFNGHFGSFIVMETDNEDYISALS